MATIVGIQFQKNGKVYNFDTNGLELRPDDYVVADTAHGADLGQVVVGCRQVEYQDAGIQLKKVLRIATEKDLQVSSENRKKEKDAFAICQKKIAEHKLDMKLVSVEYSFDNSKAMFYFTANGRVDFRSLVKDLASVFKMRIELRQIGVRDEARMIGGLGPCGRQICCGAFLDEFQPVSIKMAKEQNLSLNPTKISGVCGRLMCCLKYEQDHYEKTRKIMPRMGKEVITPDGTGTVTDLNIVKETVFVRIVNGDSSEIKEYPLEKIERPGQPNIPAQENEKPSEVPEVSSCAVPADVTDKSVRTDDNPEKTDRRSKESERQSRNENPAGRQQGNSQNAKNREGRRQDRLGKPVLRENPNRSIPTQAKQQSASGTKTAEQIPDKSPVPERKAEPEKKKQVSSWAEAVQKAMDSIE